MDNPPDQNSYDPQFVRNMIESFLRIGLLLLLLIFSYDIIKPFTVPILWGGIIAMAAFPLVKWLQPKVGDRRGLAAGLVTLLFILLLVVPTWQVTDALIGSIKNLAANLEAGAVHVPPPPAGVAEWPLVGERVFEGWSQANQNLEAVLDRAAPQIKEISSILFKRIGGL